MGWRTRSSDDVSHFLGGTRHGRCSRPVARGLEMCALDGVITRSLAGFGCGSLCRGPLHLDHGWGLTVGPGNLSLGQHTGDGKFDGETFLGRTWMFFLGGAGEGKRKCQDKYC